MLPIIQTIAGIIMSIIGKVVPYLLFWKLGKQSYRLKTAEEARKDAEEKVKRMANRPRTGRDVIDRLRNWGK